MKPYILFDAARLLLLRDFSIKSATKIEAIRRFIDAGIPLNAYVITDGNVDTLKVDHYAFWMADNTDAREWVADPLVKEKMIPIMEFILDVTEGYLVDSLKEKEANNALHC